VDVAHAMAPGASFVLPEMPGTTAQGIGAGGGYRSSPASRQSPISTPGGSG
jgi:hypothetical protein